ncbi:MAG: HD domain-containing protein, partial [Nitrospirae bacterium]|nr:HD domain-containing protein [Nitrospirota bacterium]
AKPDLNRCFRICGNTGAPADNCPLSKTLKSGQAEKSEIHEPSMKYFMLEMTSPIHENGSLIGTVHSIIDMTELKRSEENYKDLVDVYSEAINDLKGKEQINIKGKDAFLNMLEDVSESFKELELLFMSLVKVMISTLDAKSPWTRGHSERVAKVAEMIAKELGVEGDDLKYLRLAGLLHDIGKIGTYDYLLEKPDKLTRDEFEIIMKHPVQGETIIREIKQLRDITPIIRHHHENFDGTGYPDRLRGEAIPLFSRLLHIADSFDSMTSDRPYRQAPGFQYALLELRKYAGFQFDPHMVEAFFRIKDKLDR